MEECLTSQLKLKIDYRVSKVESGMAETFHRRCALCVLFCRLLNACSHVIDDQIPGPPQVKPSLPSLPNAPSLSPVKRRAKSDKEAQSASSSPVPDSKTDKKTPQKGGCYKLRLSKVV